MRCACANNVNDPPRHFLLLYLYMYILWINIVGMYCSLAHVHMQGYGQQVDGTRWLPTKLDILLEPARAPKRRATRTHTHINRNPLSSTQQPLSCSQWLCVSFSFYLARAGGAAATASYRTFTCIALLHMSVWSTLNRCKCVCFVLFHKNSNCFGFFYTVQLIAFIRWTLINISQTNSN